jgi:hypothetical protein
MEVISGPLLNDLEMIDTRNDMAQMWRLDGSGAFLGIAGAPVVYREFHSCRTVVLDRYWMISTCDIT